MASLAYATFRSDTPAFPCSRRPLNWNGKKKNCVSVVLIRDWKFVNLLCLLV